MAAKSRIVQCGCAINHLPDLLAGVSSHHASLPMEIRTRRVRRTWLERLLSWDRAYEAQAHRGSQEITQRAKTPEAAQALLLARCFVEEGVPLTDQKLQVEVRGDLIIVTHPPTQFFAIYAKPNNRSELVLKRRTDTGDNNLLVQVWRAANTKARELGWIV